MKLRHLSIWTSIFAMVIFYQCQFINLFNADKDVKINVVWHKAYEKETAKKVLLGTHWYLNYLGAELPISCFDSIKIKNNVPFELDMNQFGFNEKAIDAWSHIIKKIKKTAYYKQNNSIDIGRLITLTLNSTWHYYKITGAEKRYSTAFNKYNFDEKLFALRKGESCIAYGDRKVMIANDKEFNKTAFMGVEGTGKISDNTYTNEEYELMEIMENGFFRFAVYNSAGRLMHGATKSMSDAGKPAKCLWCHAQNINPAVLAYTDIEGYYSINEFRDIVNGKMKDLRQFRKNAKREINTNTGENHAYLEMLYISFMEPSAMRLAGEWNSSIKETTLKLSDMETHRHHEFDELGDLFKRHLVDKLPEVKPIQVPDDARETSDYEPNFFRF